jgi:hypothetical protein
LTFLKIFALTTAWYNVYRYTLYIVTEETLSTLGMHQIMILPDIRPAGYPATLKAGFRMSGRISGWSRIRNIRLLKNVTQYESRSKEKDSVESGEPGRLMPSPRPEESHEGVLESHRRLSPSQEARRKTQWSPVSRERLMPSPRPGESHEGVLESHNGLSPSQEAGRKTQ